MSEGRKAGILMPVASLPAAHGIGDFGPCAREFAKCAAEMGFKIWQILPLNPLGYGNSPYQPYSSYGGDPVYISLEILKEEGLLDRVPGYDFKEEDRKRVDYEKVRAFKEQWFRKAYEAFVPDAGYEAFVKKDWVYLYSVFDTLKEKNHDKTWTDWEQEDRDWIRKKDRKLTEEEEKEVSYQMFLQYMFHKQWAELKKFVNSLGIRIMGDIPFYVGMNSLDVWTAPECFLLDEVYQPLFIAGVPPDYFSPTGQRWGNPIYDWEHLEETDFDFWVKRIGYNGELYDIIRIDHFRAFDTYWKIPSSCPTAIEGEWVEAPGYALFDRLMELFPHIEFVAEDLGELRPEVGVLRDHYKLKGMKVLQFFLEGDRESWGETDKEELIIYTGTHDNQTVKGWFLQKTEEKQEELLEMLEDSGYGEEKIAHRFVHCALDSEALTAIVPVQDLLDLDDSGRMNTPGTVGSPNWEWRMTDLKGLKEQTEIVKKIIKESRR